jgi:hypothetical protein
VTEGKLKEIIDEVRVFTKTFKWMVPKNFASERKKFLKSDTYNPQFTYPQPPKNQVKKLKEKLSKVNSKKTRGDLSRLFQKRVKETKLKFKLITAIGDAAKITGTSEALYQCKFSKKYIEAAKKDANQKVEFRPREFLSGREAKKKIKRYLKKYDITDWDIKVEKDTDFYIQVRYKKSLITVNENINWDQGGIDTMLAHEIDGHVIRAINALNQKDEIFQNPLPFYIKTEEGLASYLGDYHSEDAAIARKHHAVKYLAGYFALNNSFRETYNFLLDFGFTPELAFQRTFRLKRGLTNTEESGCFAREAIYYEGMREVKTYIDNGGSLNKLYSAKAGLDDLKYIPSEGKVIVPKRFK